MDLVGGEGGELLVFGANADEDEVRERGVVPLAPELDFLVAESLEIVVARELDAWVVWREGLNKDFALDFAAPSPSGNLGEELEGAFACAEVGHLESDIGIDDSDEGDPGEVEAFGDHLGADEDVDFTGAKGSKGFAERAFALHDVGVHAFDDGFWEDFDDGVLDFFGAGTAVFDAWVVAFAAGFWGDGDVTADVAYDAVDIAVVREGDGAVPTFFDVAAAFAQEGGGEAAAIEEENGLLFSLKPLVHGCEQFGREDTGGVFGFVPHIDDADEGKFSVVDPGGHSQEVVFSGDGIFEAFDGRGGGAEEDGAAFDVAAHDGDIACVVAGHFLLLVGGLVFFIDDDKTEVGEWGEDGASGSNDDAGFMGADAVPFVVAFSVGEVAVEDGDFVA